MRSRLVAVGVWLALTTAGCHNDDGGDRAQESVKAVSDDTKALIKRHDALRANRRKLREQRDQLANRRKQLESSGDTQAIAKIKLDEDSLRDAERALRAKENKLAEELVSHRKAITQAVASATGGEAALIAAREAAVADRESSLARRERDLAAREQALGAREKATLKFKLEQCGTQLSAAPTIIQTVDAKGSKYTRKDVEPLLKRARRDMARKGILSIDLPAQARELEREATRAMASADYGKARFAATQLSRTVKALRIDGRFISDKIKRLDAKIKRKSLAADAQKKVSSIYREVTRYYGDGKYTRANAKLNAIYALVR